MESVTRGASGRTARQAGVVAALLSPATFGRAPILLTRPDAMSAQTAAELQRLAPTSVRVAGGPGAVAPPVMTQILELPDLP